jgi:hypothetical protein
LLLYRFLFTNWPAEVVVDADAGNAETPLGTRSFDLSQMRYFRGAKRPHVEIHAIELKLRAQIDEAQVIELFSLELRLKT